MANLKHIAIKSVDNLKGKGYHFGGGVTHTPAQQKQMKNSRFGPATEKKLKNIITGKKPQGITQKELVQRRAFAKQQRDALEANRPVRQKKRSPKSFYGDTAQLKRNYLKLMQDNMKKFNQQAVNTNKKSTMFGQRSTPKRKVNPYGNFDSTQAKAMKTFNKKNKAT